MQIKYWCVHASLAKSILSPTNPGVRREKGDFKNMRGKTSRDSEYSKEKIVFRRYYIRTVSCACFSLIKQVSGSQTDDLVCST